MAETRPQKQRIRDPEKTRAKLLQAAIDLVAAKGPDGLSLQEAAKRADVSRGIAYHHFKDPDHLLSEAKRWVAVRMQEGMRRLDGASLHDRVIYTTKFVFENPEACKLMISDALAGRSYDRRHPFIRLVMKMLEQLSAAGQARADLDVEIVTYVSFGTIATALMLREQHKGEDMDALAERYTNEWINILCSGIFAKGVKLSDLKGVTPPTPSPRSRASARK